MTSVPPPKEPAATTAPAFFSSGGDAPLTSMTTDYLALVGFAARLGTCVNNDASDEDGKTVRDEAMLLMSLLMGNNAEEILSEEIGAKESRCRKKRKKLSEQQQGGGGGGGGGRVDHRGNNNMGNFSFTFPSLSLRSDDADVAASAASSGEEAGGTDSATIRGDDIAATAAVVDDNSNELDNDSVARANDDDAVPPVPSKLLSRTRSVSDKDSVRDSSEAMAHNVLESFGAALVWRAKTWIKSLANVLALKEQERMNNAKNNARGFVGTVDAAAKVDESASQGGDMDVDDHDEDPMNSKEMQIIDAIVKSSEEVSVVNIKTAFRVLPNRRQQQQRGDKGVVVVSPQDSQRRSSSTSSPPCAQRRCRREQRSATHRLAFEATISMTSNDGVRYNGVVLQAPGYIQGTFARDDDDDVDVDPGGTTMRGETLAGVSVTLDTDALALSLERQSRLVVRMAAEAALVGAEMFGPAASPRHNNNCGGSGPHVHHSVISPRYVLMSPVPTATTGSGFPDEMSDLPPVPSERELNGEEEQENGAARRGNPSSSVDNKAGAPGAVSSSEGSSSDSSAGSPSFPALLSVANDELSRGAE